MTSPSILYVDPNAKSRQLLTSLLEDLGLEVVAMGDANEALELMSRESFHLAILDHEMPSITGAQLAARMKRLQPGTPVILISGNTSPQPHELAFVDGHFGAVSPLSDFLDTVKRLVGIKTLSLFKPARTTAWVDST
jgi:CheY-like chemotaxis protein